LTINEIGNRSIVWWERNEEGGWGYTEGEGLIDRLIGIREELMRGDYRALFLGWLGNFEADEWRNPKARAVIMPPIPSGLDHLSPALAALIEHFPVDPDALTAAAQLSQGSTPDRIPIAAVLEKLSVSEMRALVARVAEGGGASVMAELNRLTYPPVVPTGGQTLRCTDFAAQVLEIRKTRQKKEAEAAEANRRAKVEARKQHLASVFERSGSIWPGLEPLMEQKKASAYDQVAAQLKELRDAYAQAGGTSAFQQELTKFRQRYSGRSAMLRRIQEL
jgi:hypothetical protein